MFAAVGAAGLIFASPTIAQTSVNIGNNISITGDPTITTTPGTPQTVSGPISGSGSLDVNGGGTVTLSGANTYSGGTTICGTTCGVAGGSSIVVVTNSNPGTSSSIGTGTLTFDGGTLQAGAAGLTFNNGVFVNSTGATVDSNGNALTLSGLIQNGTGLPPGTLTIVDSGGGTGVVTLTNTGNLFTGATAINSGTLALGSGGSLTLSSGVGVASGATFDISGNGPGFTSIKTLGGAGTVQTGSGGTSSGLVLSNASTNFAGNITGGGGVEVAGGIETLSGTNTYTDATQIDSGATLALKGAGSIASSSLVSFLNGGTLDISQTTGGASVGGLSGNSSSSVVALGGQTLTILSGAGPFAGVITDGGIGGGTGGALTIAAGATQTLSGTNTYTGATTIQTGATLQVAGGTISSSSGVNLTGTGASFDISSTAASNNQTIQDLTGVAGSFVFLGNSALTLGTANSTIFAGTIQDGGFSGGTGGSIVKQGNGTLTLTGANTHAGGTTLSAGVLNAGVATVGTPGAITSSAIGTGTLTFDGGTLQAGLSSLTIANNAAINTTGGTIDANGDSLAYSGAIGNGNGTTGSLAIVSSVAGGTVTLTGANTYTGGTTVGSGATLALSGSGSIAASSGVADSGTFDISQTTSGAAITTLSGAGAVALGGTALTISNASTTFSGVIADGGIGGGTGGSLVLNSATQTLAGSNTYTGTTTINGGTLALGAGGSIASSSAVNLTATGATFDISNVAFSNSPTVIQDLVGVSGTTVSLGTTGLNVGTADSTVFAGVFTGSGGLTKEGSGTLTLEGNSTGFTGGTTIGAGTVALSGAGAIGQSAVNLAASGTTLDVSAATSPVIGSLSGVGGSTVDLGGTTLAVNQAGTSNFAGSFVGNNSSDVFLQGGGTEVLTGGNTNMAGSFFIDSGTLSIGPGGALPAAVGGIAINGGATFDISNGGNQTILNLGGIGTGSVTLGANTLTLVNTTPNLLPAIISGTGGLVVDAPSTLTLSGANTYTGPTTVAAGGTLYIGSGGSIASSSSLTIGGGGTFDIGSQGGGNQTVNNLSGTNANVVLGPFDLTENSTISTVYDGTITGSTPLNGLIKTGAGTLTLSRGGSYIGPTTIEAGTLALGAFGSLSSSSAINLTAAGATFDVSDVAFSNSPTTIQDLVGVAGTTVSLGTTGLNVGTANSTVFAGVFTGSGLLTKQGSGTLTLDGNSSGFTGATTISAGTLEVGDINNPGAALGGNVTVDAGATLGGRGSVLGSVTNLAGTVSPGGTIGTLSFGGNYTQGASGTLSIEVSPSAASQLKVGGAATLNGTLALVFDPGIYSATSYKILTASSVTGPFSSVTGTNPSGLARSLHYDPADVTLALSGSARPVVVAPTNDTIYTAVTSTAILNAQQVNGIILDRLGARAAGIADGQVAAASSGPATVQIAQAGPAGALGDIAAALPGALASQGAWFRGVGGFASVNGNSSAPGFTGSTGGFLAGYDRPVGPNVYLGVAGGYLHSGINEHSTSTGSEDSARFSVYGGMLVGADLLSGTAGYAHDWFNTQRGFTGIGTASANYGGDEVTAAGQWSHPVSIGGLNGGTATLTPKAGLQYLHLSAGAFSELGAGGLDLASGGHGTDSLQPYVQVALAQRFTTENGTVVAPEFRLGYAYEAFDSRVLTVTTAGGTAFPVTGVAPSRNQLSAGIGLVMEAAPNLSVYADYDTILPTGNTTEQTIQAGLRWKF